MSSSAMSESSVHASCFFPNSSSDTSPMVSSPRLPGCGAANGEAVEGNQRVKTAWTAFLFLQLPSRRLPSIGTLPLGLSPPWRSRLLLEIRRHALLFEGFCAQKCIDRLVGGLYHGNLSINVQPTSNSSCHVISRVVGTRSYFQTLHKPFH